MSMIDRLGVADLVSSMAGEGHAAVEIATALRERGHAISSGTVRGWLDQQAALRGLVIEQPAQQTAPVKPSPVAAADAAVRVIEPRGQSGRGAVELVRDMIEALDEIARNQLAIVAARQQACMDGEGDHPTRELQGLRVVQDVLKSLRAFSEAEYQLPGRRVELPPITSAESLHAALEAVRSAAAEGRLTKGEASTFLAIIERHADVLALQLAERRIAALEERLRCQEAPILEARVIHEGEAP